MRARIAVFVAIIQSILFLGHAVIYETWIYLWGAPAAPTLLAARIAVAILSVSFIAASLLAWRFWNVPVRWFYRLAAGWLGFLNYLFCGACLAWPLYGVARMLGLRSGGPPIVAALYALAVIVGVYGIANAMRIRIRHERVELENLPESWRGRTGVLVSDTHLGHVRAEGFSKQVVAQISDLRPDIVFIAGDLYDGTQADLERLAGPWSRLSPPFGTYFALGNHEEFRDPAKYLEAVESAGIRALNNQKVVVDGLQIAGVDYRASVSPRPFESALEQMALDPGRASILLSHAPHNLDVAERAGISLQLSGHTHRGQMIPFRWMVDRVFGAYAYGLHCFGKMMVYTSCGAGTWGPPLRVGTDPEIVLIRFD